MDLNKKGSQIEFDGNQTFVAKLQWTSTVDFDLAAGYETNEGKQGLIYYGNQGDLNNFPFMELSSDQKGGEPTQTHEEALRVARIDELKFLWLFCWDYGQIQTGEPTHFDETGLRISLEKESGEAFELALDSDEPGNVCLIATVDNSDPAAAKVVNSSDVGILKGLRNLSQLLAIVNSQ